ncbi:glycosyltransferase family 2 protein [Burkholderia oklahomensis]|uniref:glycosyltransferase family 2 protein n=1 Tax=Burkholderia oklahomensis TaxID=342113 RepID=UPI0005D9E9DF|nr:glycosyltransferase family 2 protein [Burkholderia oklahomensis]AJX35702.1 glycosyltransferase like 2 family protein [Burkholderia oklahomensis C6786]SUY28138.1 putative glycosyl transferase [Burkholderia oklahomensis]
MSRKSNATRPDKLSGLASQLLSRTRAEAGASPFVSVVCPTWNRRAFLPYLLYMYRYQDYPADRRELVILDDSPESNRDLIDQLAAAQSDGASIRYYHEIERMSIGQKRNKLNGLARGDYIVCMDDDDFYPPDKIRHAVEMMRSRGAAMSGSDQIYIWYSHIDKIYRTYSFGARHALNGTFAYHRDYLKSHRHDDHAALAEERSFLRDFTSPVLQIDPMRSILCISHDANTFDKDFILASCERSRLTLEDFVSDAYLLRHYRRLSRAPIETRPRWECFERVVINTSGGEARLAAFRALLAELGVASEQIVEYRATGVHARDAAAHLDIARAARDAGWRNYLLLDDRLAFVRQEKAIANVNRLLCAMDDIRWEVVLLGADVRDGVPLKTLPGVQKVNFASEAVAYAVNQSYYDVLIGYLAQASTIPEGAARFDRAWLPLMLRDRWLALYPSFAYLDEIEGGRDLAAGFFRKMGAPPVKADDASRQQPSRIAP